MRRGDLDDLAAFAAVARARSFTRAAAKLGLSPSALSHAIAGLEKRLGVRLINRTTRSVSLSQAGERFLVQFKHWHKHEVGVLAVRELKTALDAVGAQRGYVLTAGDFTPQARELGRRTGIELIGGRALIAWLRGAGRERRPRVSKGSVRAVAQIA